MNANNNFSLVGNLCKDADVVNLNKTNLVRFGLFINAQKKEGEEKAPSAIINFEKYIKKDDEETINILKKGKAVKVEGFFKAEPYTDKQGNQKVAIKLIATSIQKFVAEKKEKKEA